MATNPPTLTFRTSPITFHAPYQPPNPIPRGKYPHWNVYAVPHGPETYSIEVCWVRWTAPVNWAEVALPALLRGFEYLRTLYPDRKPMWGTISMRTAVQLYRERLREIRTDSELGEVYRAGLRAVDQFSVERKRQWHPIEDRAILQVWESLIPKNGDADMETTGAEEEDRAQGGAAGARMKLWEERTGSQPGLNAEIWWDWMP